MEYTIIMFRMNQILDERDVEAMIHEENLPEEKEIAVTAGNRRPRDEDDFDYKDKFESPLQTDITPLKSN